jgi:hypothetical protein
MKTFSHSLLIIISVIFYFAGINISHAQYYDYSPYSNYGYYGSYYSSYSPIYYSNYGYDYNTYYSHSPYNYSGYASYGMNYNYGNYYSGYSCCNYNYNPSQIFGVYTNTLVPRNAVYNYNSQPVMVNYQGRGEYNNRTRNH